MDAAASSWMTVTTIEKQESSMASYMAFRVAENTWWWDVRWVAEIADAAAGQAGPSLPTSVQRR